MATASRAPVLVVGQDEELRAALSLALEVEGYPVCQAASVTEGLETLRASEACMVVVWDATPAAGGLALLAAVLRERPLAQRHTYVLLTTSHRALLAALGRVLSTLRIAVVEMPFALEALLAPVSLADFHLRTARAQREWLPVPLPAGRLAPLTDQVAPAALPRLCLLESKRHPRCRAV